MKKYLRDLENNAKVNVFVKLFNDVDYKFFKENEKIPLKTSFVKEMMK